MSAVRVERIEDGRVVQVTLASPPRNVLDKTALLALERGLGPYASPSTDRRERAILLVAEGPSFSYGASVAEHAPALAGPMLQRFSRAVWALLTPGLPIVCAVRGQCLGGGLELALTAMRIFASGTARLGQPEIRLGALAPVASVLLAGRVGQARAEELLLSGRVIDAAEAVRIGLVDRVSDDPDAEALGYLRDQVLPHSAAALRVACRAARLSLARDLEDFLPDACRLYHDELLRTADAGEGVRAFLEKRPPRWSDR